MKIIVTVIAGCVMAGCSPEPTQSLDTGTNTSRVEVIRIGVFADDLAYGNRRGIYLIKDALTGKEYIGLSGIGIAEMGSHSTGKNTMRDER